MLELADSAPSKCVVRKDVWVRIPPAAPEPGPPLDVECVAIPPDVTACVDTRYLGAEYAYLLGLYLGDGCVSRWRKNVWALRITLDQKYPGIIDSCSAAITDIKGVPPVRVKRVGCCEVCSTWKHWPCVLPQVGSGMKHRRRIDLTDWQRYIVELHPRPFLRGLIHSDGCRVINRVKKGRYAYSRYHFSNVSSDIRAIFQWACGLVGVESRPNNAVNISVARRRSVAILDEFIGPKA